MTPPIIITTAAIIALTCLAAALRPRTHTTYRCLICGSKLPSITALEAHVHGCLPMRDACDATTEAGHACCRPEGHDGDHRCGCEWGWSW